MEVGDGVSGGGGGRRTEGVEVGGGVGGSGGRRVSESGWRERGRRGMKVSWRGWRWETEGVRRIDGKRETGG